MLLAPDSDGANDSQFSSAGPDDSDDSECDGPATSVAGPEARAGPGRSDSEFKVAGPASRHPGKAARRRLSRAGLRHGVRVRSKFAVWPARTVARRSGLDPVRALPRARSLVGHVGRTSTLTTRALWRPGQFVDATGQRLPSPDSDLA